MTHILFWIGYLAFFVMLSGYSYEDADYLKLTKQLFISMFVDIGAVYFTVYFLMPRYLLLKKYVLFFFFLFLSAGVFVMAQRVIIYFITYPLYYPQYLEKYSFFDLNPFYTFVNIYSVVGLFAAIKLLKYWYQDQQSRSELEKRSMAGELAMLRSQINPHFLFNTLNNIDSLVEEDPSKASDSIIKLSEIMRYMLYDASHEKVLLKDEIEYLKSYVALQQLRIEDPKFIELTVMGDVKSRTVPPVLFISFVENAFKHGKKNVLSPGIIIRIVVEKQFIKFEIKNYYNQPLSDDEGISEGIGMRNVRRRLELLFPNRYDLKIKHEEGEYIVLLKIYEQ